MESHSVSQSSLIRHLSSSAMAWHTIREGKRQAITTLKTLTLGGAGHRVVRIYVMAGSLSNGGGATHAMSSNQDTEKRGWRIGDGVAASPGMVDCWHITQMGMADRRRRGCMSSVVDCWSKEMLETAETFYQLWCAAKGGAQGSAACLKGTERW